MRPVAEGLIFREATTAELWVLHCADDIAVSINEVHSAGNSNRSALGINEYLDVLCHDLTLNRGNREALVSEMGGAALTLSLTQSDEYVRGLRREPFRFHRVSLAVHLSGHNAP